MTTDILRRTGGWVVELQYPLKGFGREVTAIEIRRPTADTVIRWGQWEIASTLALLSELSDLPEKLIRQLPNDDFDRVIFALTNVVGSIIKLDIEQANRPLATPEEALPEVERFVPPPDQLDPRFPAVAGPVRRLQPKLPPESPPIPTVTDVPPEGGMNMAVPDMVQPVLKHG